MINNSKLKATDNSIESSVFHYRYSPHEINSSLTNPMR